MPLRCPACFANIDIHRVRITFNCVNCHARLLSNFQNLRSSLVFGAICAEILLLLFFWVLLGRTEAAFAASFFFGGLGAYLAYDYVVFSYIKLRIDK